MRPLREPGLRLSKLNILIAYPYFKKELVDYLRGIDPNSYRLIVDSGAFTAWNTGKEITLDGYCRFLDHIEFLRPFPAVSLDVIGDPKASWENFLLMKARGYDVLPVFTRGDDEEMLEEMYDHSDYILLGGVSSGRKNANYVKWFAERNKGRDSHWLGFVKMEYIKHYRPKSVDSSSWIAGGKFGTVQFYDHSGILRSYGKDIFISKPPPKIIKMSETIGLTSDELKTLRFKKSWINIGKHDGVLTGSSDGKKSNGFFVTALSHYYRMAEVEKNLGTRIYLAITCPRQAQMLFACGKFLRERGKI